MNEARFKDAQRQYPPLQPDIDDLLRSHRYGDSGSEELKQALYTRLLEVIGENDIAPDNISPKGSAKHRIWARNALRAAQRKALAELFNVGGDDGN